MFRWEKTTTAKEPRVTLRWEDIPEADRKGIEEELTEIRESLARLSEGWCRISTHGRLGRDGWCGACAGWYTADTRGWMCSYVGPEDRRRVAWRPDFPYP